jgi:hypothetical protein
MTTYLETQPRQFKVGIRSANDLTTKFKLWLSQLISLRANSLKKRKPLINLIFPMTKSLNNKNQARLKSLILMGRALKMKNSS